MEIKLFALNTSLDWGQKIAAHLALPLSTHEEVEFADGEHKVRSLDNVRGRDVFLIQSLFHEDKASIHDKLCRLLFFIGALKDASAQFVTAVIPYFAFARKDRRTQARDPVTLRYVAQLLEAIGADRILTLDIHNLAAFQNAFRIPTEHLEAQVLFAPYLATLINNEEVTIVSPDTGGLKRAEQLRETLSGLLHREVGKAFIDKKRNLEVVSSSQEVIGELKDGIVVIVDDMISSGTTIRLSAEVLHKKGVQRIIVCATHGIFVGDANNTLSLPYLEKIIITNSIPPFRVKKQLLDKKVVVLDATALFAQAIKEIHEHGSLSALVHLTP
ncbi:ribose-phosphate diphosphokinase [Legionella clemsonensis]|uniref:ribose-phosphate diphosphokinase n=1 Tax=Legionella clemsonensis TaxID=1867846 RepID=A0A222P1D0_9GAMM|nr:ribose-phosphate pyrophosphokinase [Legionella clemsonensis]ASQ45621.1 Ribose-phosphate pyrophosphokinase [Legionella clemsonensis]